jgi:hypothetical protein
MIRTLYIHRDEADRATESFANSTPVTLTGIDPLDARATTCTGIITMLEFSPWATRYDGRQWRATVRGE